MISSPWKTHKIIIQMKNIKNKIIISTFILGISLPLISFAQDEVKTPNKDQEEKKLTREEVFNLKIEKKAREDSNNYNYYPKIELGTANLYTGATTLKQNEVFARGSASFLFNQGFVNLDGSQAQGGLPNHLRGVLQLGWGVLDNLLFTASVPAKYFLSGSPALSDSWVNLKYRFIETPFNLSFQLESKIPSGNSNTNPPFGSGDLEAGGIFSLTKYFNPIFFQIGAGYRYRASYQSIVNNQYIQNQYPSQLSYVFNTGWNFDFGGMIDVSAYGFVPLGTSTSNSYLNYNYLTVKTNLTHKFNNMEANLSADFPVITLNSEKPISINAGFTIKNSFEYARVFSLLFSKKIDAEAIEKKSYFTDVVKGKELYINSCSKCHALIEPDIYTDEKWEAVIDRYRERKILTKSEYSAIIDFLKAYKG